MQHSIHVMFGEASSEALLELRRYVAMYSDNDLSDYFTALIYLHGDDESVQIQQVVKKAEEKNTFTSNLNDIWEPVYEPIFSAGKKNLQELIQGFIYKLWRERINADYKGNDPLRFCLYIPLYAPEIWKDVKFFIEQINIKLSNVTVDIVGFCEDLAVVLEPKRAKEINLQISELNSNTRKTLDAIVKLRSSDKNCLFNNFMVLQNQTNGFALDFSLNSLVSVLGELAIVCIENYSAAFGRNTIKKDVQGVGLAMISFDKYYFQEYLLQDSFIKILKNERIDEDKVSITEAANKIDELLKPWLTLMSDFYRIEVQARLERGEEFAKVVSTIEKKLEERFIEFNELLVNSILNEPTLSLPEKKGLLHILLGEDDELFAHGTLLSSEQSILLDLDRECVGFFIDENNLLLTNDETKDECILPAYSTISEDENDTSEEAKLPIDEIKELRFKQRNYIADIRKIKDELTELKKNLTQLEESKKCLIEGGKIIFEKEEFQLLHHDDNIVPLEDKYKPHEVTDKTIDISAGFTEIKNQGQQGACMSFSMVSLFEYFLKKNHAQFPDLSEQFLYYNARKRNGREQYDEGSNSVASIMSLSEDGICSEEMWPYQVGGYAQCPSNEAYADAKKRRVRRAAMVEKDINAIKSALVDGLPIVFAVDLFPSFGKGVNGFISMPTDDEVKQLKESGENHAHAMVFCGFNDAQRVFKVRNSWGTDFGDNGYCYLSYDYITKYAYWDMVVIQEIEVAPENNSDNVVEKITDVVFVIKQTDRPQLNFQESDDVIRYALRKNYLDYLKIELNKLKDRNDVLTRYYETILMPLKDSNKRIRFQEAAIKHRQLRISEIKKEQETCLKEKNSSVEQHNRFTIHGVLIGLGLIVLTILLGWLLNKTDLNHVVYATTISVITLVLALVLFVILRIRRRKDLEALYDKQYKELCREINELEEFINFLKARYRIVGKMLDELFLINTKVKNRCSALQHYILNLKEWYKNTCEAHAKMQAKSKAPFVSLIKNDLLDAYFNSSKESIIKEHNLWRFIDNYEASEDGIVYVQRDIKQSLLEKISKFFESFSIADYIINLKEASYYPYLGHDFADICSLFEDLERKSELFVRYNLLDEACDNRKVIFIHAEDESQLETFERQIQDAITNVSVVQSSSPYKLVMFRLHELAVNEIEL